MFGEEIRTRPEQKGPLFRTEMKDETSADF